MAEISEFATEETLEKANINKMTVNLRQQLQAATKIAVISR